MKSWWRAPDDEPGLYVNTDQYPAYKESHADELVAFEGSLK